MSILGLDVGTTSMKCHVFDTSGKIISKSSLEYDVKRVNGVHEIDMLALTQAFEVVMKKATEHLTDKVQSICVSSLGESFVPIDKNGELLADSMLYSDRRGEEEVSELLLKLSEEKIALTCGVKPHEMYSLPKMMWIKKNQREIYNNTYKFLCIGDYINYLLTGEAVTDYSLASRMLTFDVRNLNWSTLLLDASGISVDKLPKPVSSGSVVGTVKANMVEKFGLDENCIVITGGHDQVCAAIGAGVVSAGQCNDGTGTVECMTIMFNEIPQDYQYYKSGYAVVPYAIDGSYVTYAFNFAGGAMLKWFRDKILFAENKELATKKIDFYEHYTSVDVERPTKLLTLPYFLGAATPYMDSNVSGAIIGLNLETTSADIFNSLMESATFEMKVNLELLEKSGVVIKECTATGGGANSKKWLQIKADILDKPIYPLTSCEGGIAGCFILSLVALGIEKDIKSAVEKYVSRGNVFNACETIKEEYNNEFCRYKNIYGSIKNI